MNDIVPTLKKKPLRIILLRDKRFEEFFIFHRFRIPKELASNDSTRSSYFYRFLFHFKTIDRLNRSTDKIE